MRTIPFNAIILIALVTAPTHFCHAGDEAAVTIVNLAMATPSRELIRNVYLSGSAAYTPIDLPSTSPLHDDFYRHVIGREPAQVKAAWARIVFTGRGVPPNVLPDVAAVKRAVAGNTKSIGYVAVRDLDASVKAVSLSPFVPE